MRLRRGLRALPLPARLLRRRRARRLPPRDLVPEQPGRIPARLLEDGAPHVRRRQAHLGGDGEHAPPLAPELEGLGLPRCDLLIVYYRLKRITALPLQDLAHALALDAEAPADVDQVEPGVLPERVDCPVP